MFNKKFSWLNKFKDNISEYGQYITIIKKVKQEVATFGIHKDTIKNIKKQLKGIVLTKAGTDFKEKIIERIARNIPKSLKNGQAYLGCSDIIESLFGKYKNYCPENIMAGMTVSVLIMAAATSKLDMVNIKQAMEFRIYREIQRWSRWAEIHCGSSRRRNGYH